ncbi:MAG: 3-phosphoshikimate 1-carboxyvinyltransferase [Terriglobia bacterium]
MIHKQMLLFAQHGIPLGRGQNPRSATIFLLQHDMTLDSSQTRTIAPARKLHGVLRLPGDKSISHRYAMLAAIADGNSEIRGFSSSADCQSTLGCLRALGVEIVQQGESVSITGRGAGGLQTPTASLDAGNSGSTIRMLAGILAGQPFKSRLVGDASLSRRPMKRIIEPLARMGARITAAEGGLPPLEIEGCELNPIDYHLPVASAQVKTTVLFAGLFARGVTSVHEPLPTRDHTEIALEQMGATITRKDQTISVTGPARLKGFSGAVPGDISSAAFFLAAALMVPGSHLVLQNIGLNPTRAAITGLLSSMGARLETVNQRTVNGEPAGDIEVWHSTLEGGEIPAESIPNLIDELPVLAVLGTQTRRGISFRGASELRVKESDRLAAVAANLRRIGAEVEEFPDGLRVAGQQKLRGAEIESYGDHRIAMAFAVAALAAQDSIAIRDAGCVNISFPEFFEMLQQVTDRG